MIKLNNQQIDALTNKIVRNLQEQDKQTESLQERLTKIWDAWSNSEDKKVFDKYNTTPSNISIINQYDPTINNEMVSAYRQGRPEHDNKLITFGTYTYKPVDKYNNIKNIIREDIILYSIDIENIEDLIAKLTNKYK